MSTLKPNAIIFSSGNSVPIAEAVKLNLDRDFSVHIWTENFFDGANTPPLNQFLKKLLCYDIAILVLGDDDIQLVGKEAAKVYVPRDNVIFELGAAMARMGTQKTFLLMPEKPPVKLPSYFKGLDPFTYSKGQNGSYAEGTGSACIRIRDHVRGLEQDAFHSDLPALGLAFGYFLNFVQPIYTTLKEAQSIRFHDSDTPWVPRHGFTLSVIIPQLLMNRLSIDEFMGLQGTANVHVRLRDGRDVSVYALPRKSADSPLNILDIPTTLLTSERVIKQVDSFWGGGDRAFKDALMLREITAFARRVRSLISEAQFNGKRIHVVDIGNLETHLQLLT